MEVWRSEGEKKKWIRPLWSLQATAPSVQVREWIPKQLSCAFFLSHSHSSSTQSIKQALLTNNLQAAPSSPSLLQNGSRREWVTPLSLPGWWLVCSSAASAALQRILPSHPPSFSHCPGPTSLLDQAPGRRTRTKKSLQGPPPLDAPGKSNAARARSRHTGKGCVEDQPRSRPRSRTVSTPHLFGLPQLIQSQPAWFDLAALAGFFRHIATLVFFWLCHHGVHSDWRRRCRGAGRSRAQLLDWQCWSSRP